MYKFNAEQNFQLTHAMEWIDTFAAEVLATDDGFLTDFVPVIDTELSDTVDAI